MDTKQSPLHQLQSLIGGEQVWTDHGWAIVFPNGTQVYAGIAKVRLQRPGRQLVDLGAWDAPAETLAAAYRAVVA